MRAWAAAALVEPHALVSVFWVAVIIGMVICVCLVATTFRHEHKGSRIAFEKANSTPRVHVAETPQAFPFLEAHSKQFPCSCTHWSDGVWCGGPPLMTSCTVFRSARVFLFTPSTSRLIGSA